MDLKLGHKKSAPGILPHITHAPYMGYCTEFDCCSCSSNGKLNDAGTSLSRANRSVLEKFDRNEIHVSLISFVSPRRLSSTISSGTSSLRKLIADKHCLLLLKFEFLGSTP